MTNKLALFTQQVHTQYEVKVCKITEIKCRGEHLSKIWGGKCGPHWNLVVDSLCNFGIDVAYPQAISVMGHTLWNDGGIFHCPCCRRHVYSVGGRNRRQGMKKQRWVNVWVNYKPLGLFWAQWQHTCKKCASLNTVWLTWLSKSIWNIKNIGSPISPTVLLLLHQDIKFSVCAETLNLCFIITQLTLHKYVAQTPTVGGESSGSIK